MKYLILTLWSLFTFFVQITSAEPVQTGQANLGTPQEVSERYQQELQKIEAGYSQKLKELSTAYLTVLLKEEVRAKKGRNLEAVLVIRNEIKHVESNLDPATSTLSEIPALSTLQEKWNRAIEELNRDKTMQHRQLSIRVATFAEQMVKNAVMDNNIDTAVEWRNLEESIKSQTPEELPPLPEITNKMVAGSIGIPHELTLWNQYNGKHNDRGTKKINITAFHKGNETWKQENIELKWEQGKDSSTKIVFNAYPADELLIEITEIIKFGGGLAEIVLKRNGVDVMPTSIQASSEYSTPTYAAENVADGNTSSEKHGTGYWLLSNGTTGWIRLKY